VEREQTIERNPLPRRTVGERNRTKVVSLVRKTEYTVLGFG
jgi:hypothetical protein